MNSPSRRGRRAGTRSTEMTTPRATCHRRGLWPRRRMYRSPVVSRLSRELRQTVATTAGADSRRIDKSLRADRSAIQYHPSRCQIPKLPAIVSRRLRRAVARVNPRHADQISKPRHKPQYKPNRGEKTTTPPLVKPPAMIDPLPPNTWEEHDAGDRKYPRYPRHCLRHRRRLIRFHKGRQLVEPIRGPRPTQINVSQPSRWQKGTLCIFSQSFVNSPKTKDLPCFLSANKPRQVVEKRRSFPNRHKLPARPLSTSITPLLWVGRNLQMRLPDVIISTISRIGRAGVGE